MTNLSGLWGDQPTDPKVVKLVQSAGTAQVLARQNRMTENVATRQHASVAVQRGRQEWQKWIPVIAVSAVVAVGAGVFLFRRRKGRAR